MKKFMTALVSMALAACDDPGATEYIGAPDGGSWEITGFVDSSADGDTDSTTDVGEDADGAVAETEMEAECHEANECEDDVECTDDECINGRCFYIPNVGYCDDSDLCTVNVCNPEGNFQGGCEFKPAPCDDNDACTADDCDKATGCTHTPDGALMCNDSDACTKDLCEAGACQHLPVTCDDGDLHTVDGCTPAGGCYHEVVECALDSECPEPNPCVPTICEFGTCTEVPLMCDDGIACTSDQCLGGECVFQETPGWCPDDGSVCTDYYCNGATGGDCQGFVTMLCDDANPCTFDSCDPAHGCESYAIPGCCLTDSQCETGDACSIPVCATDHTCTQVKQSCDDGIACTQDECDTNGNCLNTPLDTLCQAGLVCNLEVGGCAECTPWKGCAEEGPCDSGVCQAGICINSSEKCDAPKVCETDKYGGWKCVYPPGACDEAWQCEKGELDLCTEWSCANHQCLAATINCDDGNVCTLDKCQKSQGCINEWIDCDDGNVCSKDSCHPLIGCQHEAFDCADGNSCTTDECLAGYGCKNSWFKCDDGEKCTDDWCDSETGCHNKVMDSLCRDCKSDSDCGTDLICEGLKSVQYTGNCQPWGCEYSVDICFGNVCHNPACLDGAGCVQVDKCDDANPCTSDSCDWQSGECTFKPIPNCSP